MKKKMANLRTEGEIDEFWNRHDFTDQIDQFEPVPEGMRLDPKLAKKIRDRARKRHLIAIRLDGDQYARAQGLALKKSLCLSSLIRMWISEALRREMRAV